MNFENSPATQKDQSRFVRKPVSFMSEEVKRRLVLKEMALSAINSGVLITDPNAEDNPIIYANEGFARLTGYTREEIIGRNCRFLQGTDTDQETLEAVRRAIRECTACNVILLNYRKDGSSFWNHLEICPIRENEDSEGRLVYFVGVQNDVTELKRQRERLEAANRDLEEMLIREQRARADAEAAMHATS